MNDKWNPRIWIRNWLTAYSPAELAAREAARSASAKERKELAAALDRSKDADQGRRP